MLQLQCNIYNINYETAFDFLLQKITPHSNAIIQPFLKSISICSKEITEVVTTTVDEKEIQNAIVYFVNKYQQKLAHSIEKVFLKKGFTIEVLSITASVEQTAEFLFCMEFKVISSSIKILTPFLSDKLFSRLFHIKYLTDALFTLTENIFQTQCHFAQIKNINIQVIE